MTIKDAQGSVWALETLTILENSRLIVFVRRHPQAVDRPAVVRLHVLPILVLQKDGPGQAVRECAIAEQHG